MENFVLGPVVETRAVYEKRREDRYFDIFVRLSFSRYQKGDWGDTCAEDAAMNDNALRRGGERILAVYIFDYNEVSDYIKYVNSFDGETLQWAFKKREEKNPDELTIWIITEWDRSATTILFPEDY